MFPNTGTQICMRLFSWIVCYTVFVHFDMVIFKQGQGDLLCHIMFSLTMSPTRPPLLHLEIQINIGASWFGLSSLIDLTPLCGLREGLDVELITDIHPGGEPINTLCALLIKPLPSQT